MIGRLRVLGGGAVTAVGLTAAQTCAALRAAVAGFEESDHFQNTIEPEPLISAQVPLGPPAAEDNMFERIVRMAVHTIRECIPALPRGLDGTALFLGHREEFREHPDLDGREQELLRAIEKELQIRFHDGSAVLCEGNASTFLGLARARDLLNSERVDTCIVGGVDSFVNPYDLTTFENTHRLSRRGVAQGFIPGEGAAFVAVSARDLGSHAPALSEILGIGLASEEPDAIVLGDGNPTGRGLQRAIEATLVDAGVPESRIDFRISDLNGEYYRGMESMLAQSRIYRSKREELNIWVPAACVGEIGAAVGALLVIMACAGIKNAYAPGSIAMCETSSDGGKRAGCLVGGVALAA